MYDYGLYDYNMYDYGLGYSSGYFPSFFLIGGLIIFVIVAIMFILNVIGSWNLFKKAGRAGWISLVPFYNTWVLGEISGVAPWWAIISMVISFSFFGMGTLLTALFSLASLFSKFIIYYNLSKKLHKDTLTAVLLTLFEPIMLMVVGLSKNYQYDASVQVNPNGPFDSNNNVTNQGNVNNNVSVNQANSTNNAVVSNIEDNRIMDNNNYTSNTNIRGTSSDIFASKNDDTASNNNKRFCSSCGSELDAGARFCTNCGKEVK